MSSRREDGQSLVEVAIAMGVAVVIIVALVSLAATSLRGAGSARNRAQAAKLANEGMEMARQVRDSAATWAGFLSYPWAAETIGNFTRVIAVEKDLGTDDKAKVTVTVSWTDSAGTHPVTLVSYLTNWRQ